MNSVSWIPQFTSGVSIFLHSNFKINVTTTTNMCNGRLEVNLCLERQMLQMCPQHCQIRMSDSGLYGRYAAWYFPWSSFLVMGSSPTASLFAITCTMLIFWDADWSQILTGRLPALSRHTSRNLTSEEMCEEAIFPGTNRNNVMINL